MKMDELNRSVYATALALAAAVLGLFLCIFRTSNVTTLIILASFAILSFYCVISDRWTRYLLLLILTGTLALSIALYHEGNPSGVSGLFVFSVLVRFLLAGIIIAYFTTLLVQVNKRMYLRVQRLAAERQDALSESHRLLGRLNAMLGVINTISNRNRLTEILTEGLAETRNVFNADSGLIYRVGRKTGKLVIVSSFGYSDELLEKMKSKGVGDAVSCMACSRHEPVTVDNLSTDDKCDNLARVAPGSSVCVPIMTEQKVWGVLHLRRRHPDAFTAGDVQLAQAIGYQFALAMQRAYLFDEVDLLAITDPMTELYNYRKLSRDLEREVMRSRRYNHPFSFIMADLDLFKQLNDTYGHQAGDTVLRQVTHALDSGRREVDRDYRYGGEEFCVLLPETRAHEAFEVAEKLRRRIESMDVEVEGAETPLKVTISMGVASFPEDGDDAEGLITAADAALYRAKEGGRNMVVASVEQQHSPLPD